METKLTSLYNTLMLIETKGESTKLMGNCLRYIEQLISDEKSKAATQNKVESNV